MNIYYECEGSMYGVPGLYWVQRNVRTARPPGILTHRILFDRTAMQYATRVWCEDKDGIRYLKNRHCDPNKECDVGEFIWVKLRAKPLP